MNAYRAAFVSLTGVWDMRECIHPFGNSPLISNRGRQMDNPSTPLSGE
jgi:hypothetical protein